MGGNSRQWMECIGRNRNAKDFERATPCEKAKAIFRKEQDIWRWESQQKDSSNSDAILSLIAEILGNGRKTVSFEMNPISVKVGLIPSFCKGCPINIKHPLSDISQPDPWRV